MTEKEKKKGEKVEEKLQPSEIEAKKQDTKVSEEIQKKIEEMKGQKKVKKVEVPRSDEREYIIPLRAKLVKVQKYRRAGKAIKLVKEFLVRHMKVRDRDLNKIRIDTYLNDFIWTRGIKNPPTKVKVKVFREGEIVRVELAETPDRLKFKKAKLENRDKRAAEMGAKKKKAPRTPADSEKKKPESAAEPEGNKEEAKEKKAAVVEAGNKMEKAAAKQSKHMTKGLGGPKTKPIRKALAK